MTGFGQAVVHADALSCSVELRAVNNRFLKVVVRLPDCYSAFEPRLEKIIRDNVKRGTVTVAVKLEGDRASSGFRLNTAVLRQLLKELRDATGCQPEHLIAGLLTLPDVVEHAGPAGDLDALWPTLEKAVKTALASFQEMRRTEGAAMGSEIEHLRSNIATLVSAVEGRSQASVRQYHDRFYERVSTLLAE